jgi:hypothetical protein
MISCVLGVAADICALRPSSVTCAWLRASSRASANGVFPGLKLLFVVVCDVQESCRARAGDPARPRSVPRAERGIPPRLLRDVGGAHSAGGQPNIFRKRASSFFFFGRPVYSQACVFAYVGVWRVDCLLAAVSHWFACDHVVEHFLSYPKAACVLIARLLCVCRFCRTSRSWSKRASSSALDSTRSGEKERSHVYFCRSRCLAWLRLGSDRRSSVHCSASLLQVPADLYAPHHRHQCAAWPPNGSRGESFHFRRLACLLVLL